MKNFRIILLVLAFFFISSGEILAKEFQAMYSVKNSKAADVKRIADFYSRQANMYSVHSQTSYTYVLASRIDFDYYFMSFAQDGNNTVFYIYSPEDKTEVTKAILKRLKSKSLKYSKTGNKDELYKKQSEAVKICSSYNSSPSPVQQETPTAQDRTITYSQNYDFSDEAQQNYNYNPPVNTSYDFVSTGNPYELERQKNNRNNNNNVKTNNDIIILHDNNNNNNVNNYNNNQNVELPPAPVNYGNNTNINIPQSVNMVVPIVLQSSINSESLDQSDKIAALLQNDLYVNNQLKAKQGSIVYGTATEAKKAGGGYRNGSITLLFDKILTTDGQEISFTSEPIVYTNEESNRGAKIAGAMTGGILVGVATAALSALFASDPNWGVRLTSGAVAGALGSGFVVLSSTGEQVELSEGQVIQIRITNIR